MKNLILAGGLALAIGISNIGGFVRDGKNLDQLRENVLRLHILADSDSESDQKLKLMVRDAILEESGDIFSGAEDKSDAEQIAAENLGRIKKIAVETLRENGCTDAVSAEIAQVEFNERTYGDITMPAGEYTALRVKIGSAQGHNWWCVMYPPLCVPAACSEEVEDDEDAVENCFTEEEQDILYHPKKFKVRFAVWDKIQEFFN